ncbi:hypothetical protein, partial [Hydrogenoanaerobacterium sp.]|uniref:hypothetical protein n=1 Tax=Hydrogenoanaerobacterium sp. TaxID=2953763 RepID=UPI00289F2EB8
MSELLNHAITWEAETYGEFEDEPKQSSYGMKDEDIVEEAEAVGSNMTPPMLMAAAPSTDEEMVQHADVYAPYSVVGGQNEKISMATGAFQYTQPIAALKSTNAGNSFALNLIYDSDEAGESKRFVRPKSTKLYRLVMQDEIYVDDKLKSRMPQHTVYFVNEDDRNEAAELVREWYRYNWGYIPGIEGDVTTKLISAAGYKTETVLVNVMNDGQNRIEEATHLGDGWMWNIPIIDIGVGVSDITVYTVHLPGIGKFTYNPKKSKTRLVGYPRDDIKIKQSGEEYVVTTKDGANYYFATSSGLIKRQTDRYGKQITYTYDSGNNLTKIQDMYNRAITFNYSSGQVTVTPPDGNPTVLYLSGGKLDKIVDSVGRETRFTYERSKVSFTMLEYPGILWPLFLEPAYGQEVVRPAVIDDAITKLKSVEHPTGVVTNYTYTTIEEDLGAGFVEHFKLIERKDTVNGQTFNQDQYLHQKYSKDSYTASRKILSQNNAIRSYSYKFDKKHLPIEEEFSAPSKAVSAALNRKTTRTFDSYELPQRETEVTTSGSSVKTLIRVYQYNALGNLLSETNERAEGAANAEYTTTYTYDPNYSLPLSKTYKQDAATTIKVENTLASGGKDIGWTRTYENSVLKNKVQYLFDSFGNITEKQEFPDVNTDTALSTYYSYDGTYNGANLTKEWVTGVKDADGQLLGGNDTVEKAYAYDAVGNLLTQKDGNGNTISATYDKVGRPLKKADAKGGVQSYSYNDAANTSTFTDKNGTIYLYSYNPLGQLISIKNVTENGLVVVTKNYDDIGQLISESKNQDAQGVRNIRYQYDNLGRKIEMAYYESDVASTPVTSEAYVYEDVLSNGGSKLTKAVGDRKTTQYWNKYGELVQEGGVLNGSDQMTSTYHEYNYLGQKTADKQYINGQLIVVAAYDLDHQGQATKTTDALGAFTTTRFDGTGRVVEQTDKAGKPTISTYDNLGRLIKQELPFAGNTKSIKYHYYDKNGNVVKTNQTNQSDESSVASFTQTEYLYDANNKLTDTILTTESSNKIYTHYTFDAAGNTTAMYTGLTQPYSTSLPESAYTVTKYEYDSENRLVKIIYADGTYETIEYDKNGNKKATTDRNGNRIVFTYNALGKPTNENAGAKQKNYAYTNSGELLTEEESGIKIQYAYDDLGRQIQITEPNGVVKNYTYDNLGNRLSFTLSLDGNQKVNTSYDYDKLNRLTTVKENGTTVASYTYDTNGNRKTLTNANGTAVDYTYNDANLVTALTNKKGTAILSSYSYTYYLDGNQRAKTDHTGKTTAYTYDLAGRLTKEAESGDNTYAYTYDSRNNRSALIVTGKDNYNVAYTYNKDNDRLLKETKTIADRQEISSYSYDKNGNQILKAQSVLTAATGAAPEVSLHISAPEPSDLGATISTYDVWNRLTQVENKSGISNYTYYPNNLRYTKEVNGSKLCQVWDGSNLALEYTPETKAVVRNYIRGINLISMDAGTGKSYYLL